MVNQLALVSRESVRAIALLAISCSALCACSGGSGDTDGGPGSDQLFLGEQYVADDSAGTVSLDVASTTIAVGDTSNFSFTAKDAQGAPVPGLKIACDSEAGVAIIEPSTGLEITDSFGSISGIIGCELPGSFQLACRLPIGSNKRKLITIKCTGTVPAGFSGFEGAGGGGLGTGGVGDDGEPDGNTDDSIRISSIVFEEADVSPTTDIDLLQDSDCDNVATSVDPEPFSDTFIKISVTNDSASTFIMQSYSFSVPNAAAGGGTFVSGNIPLTGGSFDVPPDGAKVEFRSIFLYQRADGSSNGKAFFGSSTPLFSLLGSTVRSVTITVNGVNSAGETVSIRGKVALHFANFNRC